MDSKRLLFVILFSYAFHGCKEPSPAVVGSDQDFVQHAAIYICDKSGSSTTLYGEPVYIRSKTGSGKRVSYTVDGYIDTYNRHGLPSFSPAGQLRQRASRIPAECLAPFVRFNKVEAIEPKYFAFGLDAEENEYWDEEGSGFTYNYPAGYLKFVSSGRVELGSYAERRVDDSDMPDYHKFYGWTWEYGDFYYAKIDLGDGKYIYVVGSKKDRKIVSVFGGKPLASNGARSTRSSDRAVTL
jgi:hypothetical protein